MYADFNEICMSATPGPDKVEKVFKGATIRNRYNQVP